MYTFKLANEFQNKYNIKYCDQEAVSVLLNRENHESLPINSEKTLSGKIKLHL